MPYQEELLGVYDEYFEKYDSLAEAVEVLIKNLVKRINTHSTTSRAKERTSFIEKLKKEEKSYTSLEQITDLAGIRIITYFEDDVDRIAEIIEKEFVIDPLNSIDKRKTIDSDRFGYLSLHYVCKLDSDRLSLSEYKGYVGMKFEIQIRSILQHSWAEMEHDLGYKSKIAMPRDVRRRFSRVSSLLEVADSELIEIKNFLKKYDKQVEKNIKSNPDDVLIDRVSIHHLYLESKKVLNVDKKIAKYLKLEFRKELHPFDEFILDVLNWAEIYTVGELLENIKVYQEEIKMFAKAYIDTYYGPDFESVPRWAIYLAPFVKVIEEGKLDIIAIQSLADYNLFKYSPLKFDEDDDGAKRKKLAIDNAARLLAKYKKLKKEAKSK